MNKRAAFLTLLFFCIIVFSFKTFVSYESEYYTLDSYFHLRQVDHIMEYGTPMFDDELSYEGRTYVFPPLYNYLLAFSLELGIAKLINNFLVVVASILVFFIVFQLTKNSNISLLSSVLSLFIPASASVSGHALGPMALFLVIYLFMIYAYLLRNKFGYIPFIIGFVLALFTSAITGLFAVAMFVFLIWQKLHDQQIRKGDLEITLFIGFLSLWLYALFYQEVFKTGISFIWGNVPSQLLLNFFGGLASNQVLSILGVLPIILGIIGVEYCIKSNKKNHIFITSLAAVWFAALFMRGVLLSNSLVLLGYTAAILSGFGLKRLQAWNTLSKWSYYNIFGLLVLVVLFASTVLPYVNAHLTQELPSAEEFEILSGFNSELILTSPEEANFIMYVTGSKTYYDNYYIFSDAQRRHTNALTIFLSRNPLQAALLMDEEGIKHVYISQRTLRFYGVIDPAFLELRCVDDIFTTGAGVMYENECKPE